MAGASGQHGITRREQQVLAAAAAGMPRWQIAAEMGLARSYVDTILTRYRESDTSHLAFRKMASHGSAALLAALKQAGFA